MTEFFKDLIDEFQLPLSNPVLIFSLILLIILLSPILLKRMNIPGIIGLITSGVIVGPYGLNILEKTSAVDLFSTIGLLYIMFIAGLELDMNQFRAHRNRSLLFGFFTFIIPLTIGYPVCFYVLGYDFNASFLTASMFATHTLVAYPIVSKMGISKNQAVAITVGGTILTDTAVLIMLAVIMSNSQGNLNAQFWLRLGVSLAIFSAIMFLIIPRIAKWFFRKLESEKHSHYIFVLSVVFFAAFLAEVAGVEPIIGAFVAGLALNRLIPHSSALMNRIEFIGNSLFIPFFLISVGMLVDVTVLTKGPTALIVAATLSIVALTGKWLAALFAQLTFKYSRTQRQLIFGLSSAHAAATLAVILVGFKAEILDENILNGTVILILITCIVASFATEKAARKIVLSEDVVEVEGMAGDTVPQERILLPIADSTAIEKLLDFALLMKDKKSVLPVSILSVVPNDREAEVNIVKSKNKLEEYVKQASASEIRAEVLTTIDHNPASGIVRTSREILASMILLGWPTPRGVIENLFGENLDHILQNTDKTIVIARLEHSLVSTKRIVLIAPPLSEREPGFDFWIEKVSRLSQELSVSVVFYGDSVTNSSLKERMRAKKLESKMIFKEFQEWDDFLVLSREIVNNDLLILVTSRRGALSYLPVLDNMVTKLEKYFKETNMALIYPQQYSAVEIPGAYGETAPSTLTRGLETIFKIGRGIGEVFKREKTDDLPEEPIAGPPEEELEKKDL